MTMDRITNHAIHWMGLDLDIRYYASWSIAKAPQHDLALIEIEATGPGSPSLPFGTGPYHTLVAHPDQVALCGGPVECALLHLLAATAKTSKIPGDVLHLQYQQSRGGTVARTSTVDHGPLESREIMHLGHRLRATWWSNWRQQGPSESHRVCIEAVLLDHSHLSPLPRRYALAFEHPDVVAKAGGAIDCALRALFSTGYACYDEIGPQFYAD